MRDNILRREWKEIETTNKKEIFLLFEEDPLLLLMSHVHDRIITQVRVERLISSWWLYEGLLQGA